MPDVIIYLRIIRSTNAVNHTRNRCVASVNNLMQLKR